MNNIVKPNQNVLMFTNGAGGGHKQSVVAMKQEVDPSAKIIEVDILESALGKTISSRMYRQWNDAAKNENFKGFGIVLRLQRIGEAFINIPIFFATLHHLRKRKIDVVVNPQMVGIKSIVHAVRFHNYLKKKRITAFVQVMTELPNPKATNFFKPLKNLSNSDRKCCQLASAIPKLKEGETPKDFWKTHTGFSEKKIIHYTPVRKVFRELSKVDPSTISKIPINKGSASSLLDQVLQDTPVSFEGDKVEIKQEDGVYGLMLGSQAGFTSTKQYVQNVIEKMKETPNRNHYLFVFCGNNTDKNSLHQKLSEMILEYKKEGKMPSNLAVLPLENQDADCIARVMRRADGTLTRSGGLTSMELSIIKPQKIFIHTLSDSKDKGMPLWELGNAENLIANDRAEFISTTSDDKWIHLFNRP